MSCQQNNSQVDKIGVLITNLGSPQAPNTKAVRSYLRQFLSDKRVIEFKPRALWWLILHAFILTTRPQKSAAAYRKVWLHDDNASQFAQDFLGELTADEQSELHGSPLLAITRLQALRLQQILPANYEVAYAMSYGEPSFKQALLQLRQQGVTSLVVLPLYPQNSATTTGTTFDAITAAFSKCRGVPAMRFITDYHDRPAYISALAASVRRYWQQYEQPDVLLMSFHGLPQRYVDQGDPYYDQCLATAKLLAGQLDLDSKRWQVSFQSRLGRMPWLGPYTDKVLEQLGQQQQSVHVICPGFAADCLETIEEINLQNRELFYQAGGKQFSYIPALNIQDEHIRALAGIITSQAL